MSNETRNGDCPEYNALVDMTADLCSTLPINDMLPELVSLRVIDHGDMMELRSVGGGEGKIVEEFILKHLYPELKLGETSRFLRFITAMKQSGKSQCGLLVERLEERIAAHHRPGIST